jgi:hypothetical protein
MATAAVRKAPTQTVLLSFNPEDKRATQFLTSIKMLDFFHVEDSPYDSAFVAKIRKSEKSKKHVVQLDKLWD